MRSTTSTVAAVSTVFMALLISGSPQLHGQAGADEALIVQCTRPCAAVTAATVTAGGVVTQQFDNVDAVAVRVPKDAVATLRSVAGPDAVRKDVTIASPRPAEMIEVSGQLEAPASLNAGVSVNPENYNYNLALTNAAPLHAAGKVGQDVVVAVIDSGTANVSLLPMLSDSVIGGETFVPAVQDPLSATHRENGSHGTQTAEMVVSHGALLFLNASTLVRSLNVHAPGSAIRCDTVPGNCGLTPAVAATVSMVPMTGTAPGAKIYAMKVFPATGGGAPESRIIGAMDRAITLRRNYNSTGVNTVDSGAGTETDPFVYNSLKIDVVNMSLGGPTLFAGRDIEDQLTLAMLAAGITVVTATGNDGHAALTGGSPGTGFGSLTTAAANTAVHERVLRDNQFGFGAGEIFRPTTHTQTAYFSSRGPTADGRIDPDITANGFASFTRAFTGLTVTGQLVDCREPAAVPGSCAARTLFVSGTSFSSPTVAGAAAVLRGEHPTKNPTQIRNALQRSANPTALGDGSTRIDQGNGLLDVAAADALLRSGKVSSRVPDTGKSHHHDDDDGLGSGGGSVMRNVERAGFDIVRFRGNRYTTRVKTLKPGQVAQLFVPSDFLTSGFTVTVDQVTPENPPDQQNQFFLCGPAGGVFLCGDDVFVTIVDAPTSFARERATGFPNSQEPFTATVANPQTGLVRVALQGDWTNGGRVSATVTITRTQKFDGFPTTIAVLEQDETDFVEVDVPSGAAKAVFELAWRQNWARYPTNDLDLVLIDPMGNVNDTGATSDSPERVEIANPLPGRWRAAIIGFEIHAVHDNRGPEKDIYTFRAEADGKRLEKARR